MSSFTNIKNYRYYLKRTTVVHVLLILSTISVSKVVYEHSKPKLTFIDAAVRVDVVAMPTMTVQELKNISENIPEQSNEAAKKGIDTSTKENKQDELNAQAKPEVVKDDTFIVKNEEKKKDFLSMLKEMGKKGTLDKKNQKGSALPLMGKKNVKLSAEDLKKLKSLVLSGNQVSKGTAIIGTGDSKIDGEFSLYASRLPDVIRPLWKLPSYLFNNKNLKCRIRLYIAEDGNLLNAEVFESSGDQEYDQRAIEAVRAAAPFPKMSEAIKDRGASGSLVLGFPL